MLYTVSIKYEYYNVYITAGENNFNAAWFWVPTQLINFANNALAITEFYLLLPMLLFCIFLFIVVALSAITTAIDLKKPIEKSYSNIWKMDWLIATKIYPHFECINIIFYVSYVN